MKTAHMLVVCLAVSAAPVAFAQKWELGGGAGGGFYTSNDANRTTESATAKFKTGMAASAWLTNNTNARWGGEIRYSFQSGQAQLKQGSTTAAFDAQTHAMNYDFQWHATDVDSSTRPYIAFGGGVKVYRGTGTEQVTQPLSKTQEVKGMVSIGVGLKTKLGEHWQLRLDVHDYITPFPKDVMTPNLGTTLGGMVHDFVPMVGISWTK